MPSVQYASYMDLSVHNATVVFTCIHKGARCKRHHETIQPEVFNGFDTRYI